MNPSFDDTLADLIILVPDGDVEAAIQSLLARPQQLRIQPIHSSIYRHPQRDPGVRTKAYEFMRNFCRQFRFGLVVLDWEGSGANETPRQLEEQMDQQLEANGWNRGRAKTIVIHPELEVWVWSRSTVVSRALGWGGDDLFEWMAVEGIWNKGKIKPNDPKTAFNRTLRKIGRNRSSSIFAELARVVDFSDCQDRAFLRLRNILQE